MNAYRGGILRRIARMEAKADRRFQAEQLDQAEQKQRRADGSFIIIANVCVITLYGNPRLDESLEEAWKRALATLLQQFPNFARNGRAHPFNFAAAAVIADDFRKYVLPRLPGADDNERIYRVLARAPKWLLWHTHADLACGYLDMKVPNVSAMQRFERDGWFLGILPPGPFEQRIRHADPATAIAAKRPERHYLVPPPIETAHERRRAARILLIRAVLEVVYQMNWTEGYNNGSIRIRPPRFGPMPLTPSDWGIKVHPQALNPFD
jgi:hypothetical protein